MDALGLPLVGLLQTLIDALLLLLELPEHGLGSGDKFIFALVGLFELVLVAGPIFLILSQAASTISMSMPLAFLELRHSAVTRA
jgi:hypothetical protein